MESAENTNAGQQLSEAEYAEELGRLEVEYNAPYISLEEKKQRESRIFDTVVGRLSQIIQGNRSGLTQFLAFTRKALTGEGVVSTSSRGVGAMDQAYYGRFLERAFIQVLVPDGGANNPTDMQAP